MKKSLAATLRRWAERIDPQPKRPLYGDVHINYGDPEQLSKMLREASRRFGEPKVRRP